MKLSRRKSRDRHAYANRQHSGVDVSQPRVLRVVALASPTGRYGGPFDTARAQLDALSRPGRRLTLFAPHLRNEPPEVKADFNFDFISPKASTIAGLGVAGVFSFRALFVLIQNVRRSEVVHVSIAREPIPFVAALASLLLRKKLVLQPHGMLTARTSAAHRLVDLLVRPVAKRADSIIALTTSETDEIRAWLGCNAGRVAEIGNPALRGAEQLRRLRSLGEDPEILFLGRLHPRKRVRDFVRAAEIGSSTTLRVRWSVVGPDQGDGEILRQASSSAVSYEGAIPGGAVPARIDAASIFVLPSESEPWGNGLVAALTMGVPVVVSASSALSDLVHRTGAGYTFDDGDAQALFEAVEHLLDPQNYELASAAAIILGSTHFSDEQVRFRLEEEYGMRGES